jgi:nicotinamidase/pyrazinamidase
MHTLSKSWVVDFRKEEIESYTNTTRLVIIGTAFEGKGQVLWPPHCVQKTLRAEILLDKKLFTAVVKMGMDSKYDSYSGFHDDGGKKTDMDRLLKREKINKMVVFGIATDYCVRATALDAVAAGYKVIMIKNLSRRIAPDTSQKYIDEMKAKGIVILDDLDLKKIKAN